MHRVGGVDQATLAGARPDPLWPADRQYDIALVEHRVDVFREVDTGRDVVDVAEHRLPPVSRSKIRPMQAWISAVALSI
jgi:hypothetical protein